MIIRAIDVDDFGQALNVLELQMKAYLLEAEWLGLSDPSPLRDTVASLAASGECFVGCFEQMAGDKNKGSRETGDLPFVGVIAFKQENNYTYITRLMVRPTHFRQGIASLLINYVDKNRLKQIPLAVYASTRNLPAMKLYKKLGFDKAAEMVTEAGVSLTFWVKP